MQDRRGRGLDFHTVTFDQAGGGNQQLQDGKIYRYIPEGFAGIGTVEGVKVRCLTPEVQADCHYSYEPDDKDRHDMGLLSYKFKLPLKAPYSAGGTDGDRKA